MTESDGGVNDSGPDIPHDAKATFDCIISHLGGFPVSAERLKEVDWGICRFLVGQRELLLFPKAVRRKRKLAPIRVPEPEAHPCDLAWFCLAQSPLLHACALCVVFVPPALTIRKYLAAKEQLFRPASKFVEPAVKVAHLSEWFPKFWVRWLDRSDIRTHALVFGSALARTLYELSGIGIQRLSAVADLTKVTQPRAKTLGSIWARTATEAILKASLDATGFLGYQAGLSKIQGRLSGETLTHAGHAWAWAVGNGLRRRLPAATDDDAKPLVQELDYEMHAVLGRGIISSPFPEGDVPAESSATDWLKRTYRVSDDGKTPVPSDAWDSYPGLKKLVESRLKKKQKRIVVLLVEAGGKMPLADLGTDEQINWEAPCDDQFNSIKKAINAKFKSGGLRYRVERHDNNARIVNLPNQSGQE